MAARPNNRENIMSLADQLIWGMSTYSSMFNYETQAGEIAEPVTASKGNGHVVVVEYTGFTPNRMVKWTRGNTDSTWYGEELL